MSNHHHHHHSEHQVEASEAQNPCDADVLEPEIMTDEEVDAMDAEADENTAGNADGHASDAETESGEQSGSADNVDDSESEACAENTNEEEEDKPAETDWRDAYVRLAADFDNYRKRTSKEFDDVRKRERERVINVWLDVYDNAERAIHSLPEKEGPWYEGFVQLVQQMDRCLATLSIHPVDDMGKPFDPKRHEAIATCPNPAMENNTIMHVERRGFEYENGDIARIARVIVVRNPS